MTEDEKRRLDAAEDLCVMFGWCAARDKTDRDAAALELWMRWAAITERPTGPEGNEHLDEVALAAFRRATEDQHRARFEEAFGLPPKTELEEPD